MARSSKRRVDPELEAHKAWLGLVQPVGLVVAPPALIKAQVVLDKNIVSVQQALKSVVERPAAVYTDPDPVLTDFPRFAAEVLGWSPEDLAGAPGGPALPERLSVHLPDYGETLRPDYAAVDAFASEGDEPKVLMLVSIAERDANLDKPPKDGKRDGWHASPQARLERMLRDADVPAGLVCNGAELRLVYAPRGESSGHVGFPVAEMCTVGGRPILAALHMLLGEHRMFGAGDGQRLLDLMAESRKYQSEVSNRLSEQVLEALWELLRGFQAADEAAGGRVLYDLARNNPDEIYGGLLTVIMRLVFLLYAEDQGLMPDSEVYTRNYSVGGLYERLREDAGRYPDTMEQRYGAYAWLLAAFRMVFDGGGHGDLRLPTRHGQLFNPDEYPFLEGRPPGLVRVMGETFEAPRVSDGVIWRVLEGLLVLDGERLSYRALDVEQIGSVYESMMGFDVETMVGRAIAVRPKHIVIDLDELLTQPGGKRKKWLKDNGDCELSGNAAKALKDAETLDDLVAALERRVSPWTPRPLPRGALFLQPGEERRRSGSHYTPRELTQPIVRTTLRPVLEGLGERPMPEQILDLKVCDPAMGSGAFLVEACRQLAEALVQAWELHDSIPAIPPDEDPLLHARRLVAQRCLYGVDKNPFAVNLAKLSIWLVTLARDHAFTFIDHALKHGDSLVGLTREQIGAFHWKVSKPDWGPLFEGVTASANEASGWRKEIQSLGEGDYDQRRAAWREAEDALYKARIVGDVCIAAFLGAEAEGGKEALRLSYRRKVDEQQRGDGLSAELVAIAGTIRAAGRPVRPFHWELEFPEVFEADRSGFDALIGNPPFLWGQRISTRLGATYFQLLRTLFSQVHGVADLVVYFFLRASRIVRTGGCFGLIATDTIRQGDTRESSLDVLVRSGFEIFDATTSLSWPGAATVQVSKVFLVRGTYAGQKHLDGYQVPAISPRLTVQEADAEEWAPAKLATPLVDSYVGSYVYGDGFLLSQPEHDDLVSADHESAQVIQPYLIGDDVLSDPGCRPSRFAINFGQMTEEQARGFTGAFARVESLVKPVRMAQKRETRRKKWWQYAEKASRLYQRIDSLSRVLVHPYVATYLSFEFVPASYVYASPMVVLISDDELDFLFLQNSIHEAWVRAYCSTLGKGLRYTTSDGLTKYPPPQDLTEATRATLRALSNRYLAQRQDSKTSLQSGLTGVYAAFHDPQVTTPKISQLRDTQTEMDRAVLDAYGWADIPTDYDFFLDYEIDEETWGNKKKPWRYRWPDEVHDEVLARLLDLNQKRYEEEVAAGLHDKGKKKTPRKKSSTKKKTRKKAPKAQGQLLSLFESPEPGDDA